MKDFKQEEKGIKKDIQDKVIKQILGITFGIIVIGGITFGIYKAVENHSENKNITTTYVSDDTVPATEDKSSVKSTQKDNQDIFDIFSNESTSSSQNHEYEIIGGMEYNDVVYFSSNGLSTGDYLSSSFSIKTYRDINTSVNYFSLTRSGEAQRIIRYNADGSCNTSLPNGKDNVKCVDYEIGNSGSYYRIVDVDTGVTYMVVFSSNEASITPLYNADGSLMINN